MYALYVDIDGTLTETKSGKKFKESPADIAPIEGAMEALNYFYSKGWGIFGISNQGGVEAGHKSLGDCIEEMANTLQVFKAVERIYFCTDFAGTQLYCVSRYLNTMDVDRVILPQGWASCRKPNIGTIAHIRNMMGAPKIIDEIFVGDRPEDEQAARTAGITFILASKWRSKLYN